ncbi:tyrosine-type recombinase/integrase [Kitasatospora sp. CB02891]|uniref:tyrosine-type recombinase/integrase n=1 Tax=Kitasatospora sp. CB02891 TaxID=2020329 RepID=UPI0012FD5363|nr:tyrosine-type recombinase/integrase [Kitasatospora sp. CB02891]
MCPPKTAAGERTIALDSGTVHVLTTHRNQQKLEKAAAGKLWRDSEYAFTDRYGRPLRPDHIGYTFQLLVRASGLPPVRLHDLRHGAASLALTGSCDLKVIQAQLGHSTIVTTADTYTSVLPQTAHDGAENTDQQLSQCPTRGPPSTHHRPEHDEGRPPRRENAQVRRHFGLVGRQGFEP